MPEYYKGFFIEPQSSQLTDSERWDSSFTLRLQHNPDKTDVTPFHLIDSSFDTREAAIQSATIRARQKIDDGFAPREKA
jgi:hypothetical protein